MLSALGVYTVGLVTLSGVVLDRSLIDYGPLALDRFDLVPTLFVLAAVLARDRERSATWSGLLSIGVAIKAFPLFLYPALLRGERNLRRVIVAGAIPLLACAAAVIVMGDEFGSAITYHTERTLQVESLGASVFEVAHVLGASGVSTGVGHGGFEISASGATAARWLSVVIGAAGYLWLVWAGWRSKATNFELVAALLAVLVVFAPVLSPQFLLWLLPVSACAYGLGKAEHGPPPGDPLHADRAAALRRRRCTLRQLRLAAGGAERPAARLPGAGGGADRSGWRRTGERTASPSDRGRHAAAAGRYAFDL